MQADYSKSALFLVGVNVLEKSRKQ